jgi:hypothetical protein
MDNLVKYGGLSKKQVEIINVSEGYFMRNFLADPNVTARHIGVGAVS